MEPTGHYLDTGAHWSPFTKSRQGQLLACHKRQKTTTQPAGRPKQRRVPVHHRYLGDICPYGQAAPGAVQRSHLESAGRPSTVVPRPDVCNLAPPLLAAADRSTEDRPVPSRHAECSGVPSNSAVYRQEATTPVIALGQLSSRLFPPQHTLRCQQACVPCVAYRTLL